MCNRGLDSNGSQFFWSFREHQEWDEKHVVFGCAATEDSLKVLYAIDSVGSQFGRPAKEVLIADCGQLWPKR